MSFKLDPRIKQTTENMNSFLTPIYNANGELNGEKRSSSTLNYRTVNHIPETCYTDNSFTNFRKNSDFIDVESDLRGLNKINSKSDSEIRKRKAPKLNDNSLNICPPFLYDPELSREKKSCKTTTSLVVDRFEYPYEDNFSRFTEHGNGVNSRLRK